MNSPHTQSDAEFVEKGADLEHKRWAMWQAHLHSKCVEHENGKGEWICFPSELMKQWNRQIETSYADLSEKEKESDRREVRSYLPLVHDLYLPKQYVREVLEGMRKQPFGTDQFGTELYLQGSGEMQFNNAIDEVLTKLGLTD